MLIFSHEKILTHSHPSRGEPRASLGLRSENPGGLYGNQDRGSGADRGGSASGMDLRGLGPEPSKLESLDAQGQRTRVGLLKTSTQTGTSCPFDSPDSSGIRGAAGETSFRVWAQSGPLGWPHLSGSPPASLWNQAEGPSGAVLDAPIGISTETGQLFLPAGPGRRKQAVPQIVKKNCGPWDPRRPSSLRTKPVSRPILVWGSVGPREGNGFVSLPPANIAKGSMSSVGWPLCWVEEAS